MNQPAEPTFPRAPSQAAWDAMTPERQRHVVETLPLSVTEAECSPPEGDWHSEAKLEAADALRGYFGRRKRQVYIALELTVYYPDAQRFAPDLLVVFDVEIRRRNTWVVSAEGKGLDFALEVHYGGDRRKDAERNLALYAGLGIPEYFIYDRRRQRIHGYRLSAPHARTYEPILPQLGHYRSTVLGLDLVLEQGKLRFWSESGPVLQTAEWVQHLEQQMGELQARIDEEARLREEESRLRAEESRLREAAEQKLAEAMAEVERLKRRE